MKLAGRDGGREGGSKRASEAGRQKGRKVGREGGREGGRGREGGTQGSRRLSFCIIEGAVWVGWGTDRRGRPCINSNMDWQPLHSAEALRTVALLTGAEKAVVNFAVAASPYARMIAEHAMGYTHVYPLRSVCLNGSCVELSVVDGTLAAKPAE
jgi:hypothetical protein